MDANQFLAERSEQETDAIANLSGGNVASVLGLGWFIHPVSFEYEFAKFVSQILKFVAAIVVDEHFV